MRVRLAVIGGGIYGSHVLKVFKQCEYAGMAKLAALADINPETLRKYEEALGIKGYLDYKEMLAKEDIDAVAVVTPDFLHREIAIDVASSGKQLLVEKPLDITVAGCDEIIRATRENGVLLEVDFHKRYDPAFRQLKRAIMAGSLGEVEYGYAWAEDTVEVPSEWFGKWASKSSPAWFVGIHIYDLILWLLGMKVVKVYASGVKKRLVEMGIDTYDSLQAKIEFENGASITVDSSWILPKRFEAIINQGLRVVGSNGIWEIDGQNRGIETCTEGDSGMRTPNFYFTEENEDEHGRLVYSGYGVASVEAFVRHVLYLKDGGNLDTLSGHYASGEEAREATRIAVAVHESAEQGKVIPL